nr:transposase [Modestobacter sp. DSM 44400]
MPWTASSSRCASRSPRPPCGRSWAIADASPPSRKAVRHTGLDITVHSSDGKRPPGHLSRQGSPLLRWALFGAAQCAARPGSPDYGYYRQVADRAGGNRAACRWPARWFAGRTTRCAPSVTRPWLRSDRRSRGARICPPTDARGPLQLKRCRPCPRARTALIDRAPPPLLVHASIHEGVHTHLCTGCHRRNPFGEPARIRRHTFGATRCRQAASSAAVRRPSPACRCVRRVPLSTDMCSTAGKYEGP